MAQRPDEMSDTQQPPPVSGGLTDLTSFNMSPASRPHMAVDSNNLGYSNPKHAQAGQNLEVASGTTPSMDSMLLQQFGNRIESGHDSNQVIPTGYNQYAGMADNASSVHQFLQPGWIDMQPMDHQVGSSLGYGVANMNHTGPGGLGQSHVSTPPVVANTDPKAQQGQREPVCWIPNMDKMLLSLKDDRETHERIAQKLETEFPSAKGVNKNMVAKRLRYLRESVADVTKVVNRCIPRMLPALSDAVAQVAQEHGYEYVGNEEEDIEVWLRKELPKVLQKNMLGRKRTEATGRGQSASQAQTRVTKRNGRRPRASHVNSGGFKSDNASRSTDQSTSTDQTTSANPSTSTGFNPATDQEGVFWG